TTVLTDWMGARGVPFRLVGPDPTRPNILACVEGARSGRHLVLNGHVDTFPVAGAERWRHDPLGGTIADGKVFGTGSSDMKQGTASMVALFCWLHALRDRLAGTLTLTAVSDEETFGPAGARFLVEHHAEEVLGDCLLNAEPGAPTTVRFGEKAPLWFAIEVQTMGCHGAYTHKSPSATKIAAAIIGDLAAIEHAPSQLPPEVAAAIAAGAEEIDRVHLPGAARTMGAVTLNIGCWNGGTLVNMLPGHCRIEADIRVPWGTRPADLIARVRDIVARHPAARIEVLFQQEPRWSDPAHPMVRHIQRNAAAVAAWQVKPIPSLAGTDARLWRERGVPAFSYGTTATNVAMPDEHTDIDEWLRVVRVHALSALDYLTGEDRA
ncbi:M20/M25/M40 family metallo-hydrolase, partial [Elioraea sp.]|uniref:M20/M25/M40 family metallo-hydrolase n=1 Tax=Elioraea sp. TaxID=2185103 RepID=UPI003F6EDFF1